MFYKLSPTAINTLVNNADRSGERYIVLLRNCLELLRYSTDNSCRVAYDGIYQIYATVGEYPPGGDIVIEDSGIANDLELAFTAINKSNIANHTMTIIVSDYCQGKRIRDYE